MVARLIKFLEGLVAQRFFGRVTICFQNGKMGEVKVEQTRKFEDL